MIKLALIGKNIQHSKSPEIYCKILGNQIQYDLLDYKKTEEIPSAEKLLDKYDGISITGPYKKHFVPEIKLNEEASQVGAINCLRRKSGSIEGGNTDLYAIQVSLEDLLKLYKKLNIIILGDGVMSKATQVVLTKLGIDDFQIFSRRKTNCFDQLNVKQVFEKDFKKEGQEIVINSCSRDFVFIGLIDQKTIFWDYNYNLKEHSRSLTPKVQQYIDGQDMLELQARAAVAFWSIKTT